MWWEKQRGDFRISTDPGRLDRKLIHSFLSEESGWSKGIPYERVNRSIDNSLNFGVYDGPEMVGYARVISDLATIAYLGDVFVLPAYRGRGLSRMLLDAILEHPDLQGLRRWILLTSTAEALYRKYGFNQPARPEIYMEKYDPEVYAPGGAGVK